MPTDANSANLLTAALLHELRHPLMGMKLGLQLVQRAAGDAVTGQPEWPIVLAQLGRIEELLGSYRQLVSNELIATEVFELAPVVRRAIDLCRHRLAPLGERFTAALPPDGVYAHGTPESLIHAITNVLSNAADAARGRIGLRVLPSATNDGRIEIRITDGGPGVPPELAATIFEPRFTTKPKNLGSGLGLTIARRMMESVGGEVTVVDGADVFREPWAGAELRIALWVQPPRPAARGDLGPAASPGARRVLIVEDDPMIQKMLQRALELGNYAVTCAASAEEAIGLLDQAAFDAVVTDKNLPKQSGEAVAQAVRARCPDTALVMMTGYATRESASALQRLRADGYLTKPFEISDLTRLLGRVITRRKNTAGLRAEAQRRGAGQPIGRIAIVEPDAKEALRLEALVKAQGRQALVRAKVEAALDERPDALIVNGSALSPALKQRLLDLQAEQPDFRVVLISGEQDLGASISAILVNARAHLVRPWTDALAAKELEAAFDPDELLR